MLCFGYPDTQAWLKRYRFITILQRKQLLFWPTARRHWIRTWLGNLSSPQKQSYETRRFVLVESACQRHARSLGFLYLRKGLLLQRLWLITGLDINHPGIPGRSKHFQQRLFRLLPWWSPDGKEVVSILPGKDSDVYKNPTPDQNSQKLGTLV